MLEEVRANVAAGKVVQSAASAATKRIRSAKDAGIAQIHSAVEEGVRKLQKLSSLVPVDAPTLLAAPALDGEVDEEMRTSNEKLQKACVQRLETEQLREQEQQARRAADRLALLQGIPAPKHMLAWFAADLETYRLSAILAPSE